MSYSNFHLEIMAADHLVFNGQATQVNLPTSDGRVGILAGHSNLIMAVISGTIDFDAVASESLDSESRNSRSITEPGRHTIVVSNGILKVENGEVIILVGTAERPEEIDETRARRAEEEARAKLKRANTNRDHAMAEAELHRAMSRIKASRSTHKL